MIHPPRNFVNLGVQLRKNSMPWKHIDSNIIIGYPTTWNQTVVHGKLLHEITAPTLMMRANHLMRGWYCSQLPPGCSIIKTPPLITAKRISSTALKGCPSCTIKTGNMCTTVYKQRLISQKRSRLCVSKPTTDQRSHYL